MKTKKLSKNIRRRNYTKAILIIIGVFIGMLMLLAILSQFDFANQILFGDTDIVDIFGYMVEYSVTLVVIIVFILFVLKFRIK